MDNKKRMMFVLEEDYYYITIKILLILRCLNCTKKYFKDYQKLSFLLEFIKGDSYIRLLKKSILDSVNIHLEDREKLVNVYYKAKLNNAVIQRVLFFLEKKKIIELKKDIRTITIDIKLIEIELVDEIFKEDIFRKDEDICNMIKEIYPRVSSVKYDTFTEKVFGY